MKVSLSLRDGNNRVVTQGATPVERLSMGMPLVFDDHARLMLAAGLWEVTGSATPLLTAPPQILEAKTSRHLLTLRSMQEKMTLTLTAFLQEMGWDPDPQLIALSEFFSQWESTLYRLLDPVFSRLSDLGIRTMLLKGGDLRVSGRGARPGIARMMSDLDLLVKPPDVPTVQSILIENGFEQGIIDRSTLSFRRAQTAGCSPVDISPYYPADHYELPVFGKFVAVPDVMSYLGHIQEYLQMRDYQVTVVDNDPYIAIKCDVHVNVSRGIHLDDVWRGARDVRLPSGRYILGQSPAGLVWFLASRLYHETFHSKGATIRQFVDVLIVLQTWGNEINWDEVVSIAEKYELRPSLFYVLTHVNELLGSVVPEEFIRSMSPMRAGVLRQHDWGDFMPKLLGGAYVARILEEEFKKS